MNRRLGRRFAGLALAGALFASGRVYGMDSSEQPVSVGSISPAGPVYVVFNHTNYHGRRKNSASEEEMRTLGNIGKGVLILGSIGLALGFGYFALTNRRKE